jgi:hypothetical protein
MFDQRYRELILPELRVAARFRNRPDVNKLLNALSLQYFEELLDGQRGVTDGEYRQGFTAVRRYARIAESSASL